MSLRSFIAVILLLCITACGTVEKKPDHYGAKALSYDQLRGWQNDNHADALRVFLASCPVLAKKARPVSIGSNLQLTESLWQSLCSEASGVTPGDAQQARAFFERRFTPYRISNNGQEKGLFTGYYEPLLYGSRKKGGDFLYPVYAPPKDLKKDQPYYTRQQIENGALAKKRLELVWVDDPVMLFFMQVQGSGRIRLTDGSEIRVGYAGKNNQPYVSLGKVMGDEGLLPKDKIDFFTIRQWLYDNRSRAMNIMQRNPSYVFFKEVAKQGAVGAVGVVLTAERSMAVDSNYTPYGLPVFLEVELPGRMPGQPSSPYNRILITQDTGGAIRGPVRGDIFFGSGDSAEYLAGMMKNKGVFSVLVPNEIAYLL